MYTHLIYDPIQGEKLFGVQWISTAVTDPEEPSSSSQAEQVRCC